MKTAVITGGNSGIGKSVATALAKMNYRIIIHGRDHNKTISAAREIKEHSGNQRVEFISKDISTIRGMKELANEIKQKTDSIETLVLSTGVILFNHILTPDGLEKGFAVQYLSRFAITNLLMAELMKGNAKIVSVGAPIMKGAKIFFDDIALKNNFTMLRALGQEMLANHLMVQEFARRNPDCKVVMNIGNVGIAKTGIVRNLNPVFRLLLNLIGQSPEKAARNFVYLASDPAVTFSGFFLKKPGRPFIKEKIQQDPRVAEKLWEMSLNLIR